MPHINRIRVNNVKYNFGTQFYDDFVMRFDGRNALYDLANGGGKSVLMLLLFQNLIPNCTLDDKQPIEKLFRTGEGSTSIHSMIEWKLDDCDVEDGYKYMLTGFCARKAKDDDENKNRETASIDYYNYVIFYQSYNDNDLVNLPLSKGKERMTYVGLRSYLKDLEHKDFSLKIRIFDRKGEYQRFISRYGLYESQWEIIRGINKTEGHVRTYFENTYKTTRKVIEDLLIEEIIQKAFVNKTEGEDADMAGTLLSIREKILELSKKRQEIASYDRQVDALDSFKSRIEGLTKLYKDEDQFKYDLIKAYNGLLIGIKQQERSQDVSLKEQEFTKKHMEEISRKLDTIKVQKNQETLRNIENDTSVIEGKVKDLEAEYGRTSLELSKAESTRDYLEYLECMKHADIIRGAIAGADDGSQELLEKLQNLSGQGKYLIDIQRKSLAAKIQEGTEKIQKVEKSVQESDHQIRKQDMDLAVLENQLSRSALQEKQWIQEIAKLRQSVNVLLIEGTEREVKNYIAAENQIRNQLEENLNKQNEIAEIIQDNTLSLEQIKAQIAAGSYQKTNLEEFFNTYEEQRPKADNLLKIYGVESYDQLKENVYSRYRKISTDIYLSGKEQESLKILEEQLKEKNPILVSDGVAQVMDYLKRCHNASCITGCDYLKDLSDEEKMDILKRMPFLPYAVVVRTGFSKIQDDFVFSSKDFGAYQVPIIRLEAVVSGEKILDDQQICFTGKNPRLFVDDEAIANELENVRKRITEIQNRYHRLVDQSNTYVDDLAYIHHFVDEYYMKQAKMLAKRDEYEKMMTASAQKLQKTEKELNVQRNIQKELQLAHNVIQENLGDATAKREVIEQIYALNQQMDYLKNEVRHWNQQKKHLEEERQQTERGLISLKNENLVLCKQVDALEQRDLELKNLWTKVLMSYFKEEVEVTENQSLNDIEVAFKSAESAYKSGHSDMEDKKKLLENYEKSMERLVRNITSRQMSIDELAKMQNADTFIPSDEDTIKSLYSELDRINQELRLQRALAEDSKADKHRLTGRVENGISVIEEKYGYYKEIDLKNMDYEVFIQEYTMSYNQMKEKLNTLSKTLEKVIKDLRSMDDLKKDLERLIRSTGVSFNYTKDSTLPDENYYQVVKSLSERYERLRKDEDLKKAEFERNKDILVDTLRKLNADELSDEVRYHMLLPVDGDDADLMLSNLGETISIIMLEKDRVLKGIDDMVKIKENFENQCLQRCTDIKMELDRLSKMSQITLGDEDIQMITLKIPYIKEEFYSQKMSEYIDHIVVQSDALNSDGERLKYLRHQLAWKHLFSVIVADMDAIRLSLYKRERIKEQSRFLRYEEAVGSTGQSQGIYIQFLIAIINYISAINSRNTEVAALKKVIFIDNPFGAAKDIYIWEPIFALLKENNVQLIVPARGATPAITGKFDVNYVLGQKLIGTKQQTVVVDYHSNIVIDEVEYRQIEFEQEVFSFV